MLNRKRTWLGTLQECVLFHRSQILKFLSCRTINEWRLCNRSWTSGVDAPDWGSRDSFYVQSFALACRRHTLLAILDMDPSGWSLVVFSVSSSLQSNRPIGTDHQSHCLSQQTRLVFRAATSHFRIAWNVMRRLSMCRFACLIVWHCLLDPATALS